MKKIYIVIYLIMLFFLIQTVLCAEVIFTEDFEEPTINDVIVNWTDFLNINGMSLSGDVSSLSTGTQSLMMTSIIGQNTGGYLYKRLDGYDSLYARFYVKIASTCHPIHHFVHMGGYNPPTNWPQGHAGEKPNGDDRFTTGIETMGSSWRWDFYTYWMHMRACPSGKFWGNDFNPVPTAHVEKGEWICVEFMIKCNNPVTSYNGEQAFWINGQLIHHLGEGFPNGYWIWDSFYPDSDSTPFEGFQWRFVDELDVNFFWLLFYLTDGYPGQVDSVWFDDIILATEYIGPIVAVEEDIVNIHPNTYSVHMGEAFITFDNLNSGNNIKIYDVSGKLIHNSGNIANDTYRWNINNVKSGLYFYYIDGIERISGKIVILN